jgi:hypothetical protein
MDETWMTYYDAKCGDKTAREFMKEAAEQCGRYHRSLIEGNINPMRVSDKPIYEIILLAIGSRLIVDVMTDGRRIDL